ncbi:MAG: AAA family ATPase, partial [Nitrososphaerales archaeon]
MLPFVEKYRPKTLDDFVGNSEVIRSLKAFVSTEQFPLSMIFYGDFGVGKTAAAKALARDYFVKKGLYASDVAFSDIVADPFLSPALFIDASVENDVYTIKERVRRFMQHLGLKDAKKIVIFDEADRLGYSAQGALRPLIERYPNTLTIYTTNVLDGIDGAIQSRAAGGIFHFKTPTPMELEELLLNIASKEGLDTSRSDVKELAKAISTSAKSPREAVGLLGTEILVWRSEGRIRPQLVKAEVEEKKVFEQNGRQGLKSVERGLANERQIAATKAWIKIYRKRGQEDKAKQIEEALR